MSYLGNNPNKGSFFQQKLAGDGSTTSFTLLQSVTDGSQLLVTIGNVIQEEGNGKAYTASGATLTFDSAPTNGDVIVVRYLGRSLDTPTTYATQITFKYVATNGQTAFTGSDANGITLSYTIGSVDVYLNGVHLDTTDFTETNESTLTLASGATTSDEVVIVAKRTITLTDVVPKSAGGTFAGNVIAGGNLTVNGAFTSQGIDDNADATAITIDSSENVSIGGTTAITTSGQTSLTIGNGSANPAITLYSATNNQGQISFGDATSGTGAYEGYIAYSHSSNIMNFGTNHAEAMRITSGGDLLVNTTTDTSGGFSVQTISSNTTSTRMLAHGFSVRNNWGSATNLGQGIFSPAGSTLAFSTASTERMRIDSSGLLHLNTTSGNERLNVNGAIRISNSSANFNAGNKGLLLDYDTSNNIARIGTVNGSGSGAGAITFMNAGTEFMRLINGKLGVGTDNPEGKLTVNVNTVHSDGIYINNASSGGGELDLVSLGTSYSSHGASGGEVWLYSPDNINIGGASGGSNAVKFLGSGSERMRIHATGQVGIGQTANQATLCIFGHQQAYTGLQIKNGTNNGSTIFALFVRSNGTATGSIQQSSDGATTIFNTTSDYRLKESISYDFDATTRLKQLKPCRFVFKESLTGQTVDGFLAHEVSSTVPEAVSGTKDEIDADGKAKYQGIDHSKLVPLLTKTLQEALTRIETLEAEVKALKG